MYEVVERELTHPAEFFDLLNNNIKPNVDRTDVMEKIQHRTLQTLCKGRDSHLCDPLGHFGHT